MGSCGSQEDTTKTNKQDAISEEETIRVEKADFVKHSIQILILGSGECGKTTFWRHLKIIYFGGFSSGERRAFINLLKVTILEDLHTLLSIEDNVIKRLPRDIQNYARVINELENSADELTPDIVEAIHHLWNDDEIQRFYDKSMSSGFGEHASFFFDSIRRICEPDYIPTDEDILKARIRTTGRNIVKFRFCDVNTLLIDVGGQRSARTSWINDFQNSHYVMFVASLSDFDQNMYEDQNTRRTDDTRELFRNIVTSPIFENTPFFLVLNKYDLFVKKLKKNPQLFAEVYHYEGDTNDIDACLECVKESFLKQIPPRPEHAQIIPIPTCAMDEKSIRQLFQEIGKKVVNYQKPPQ